jgi:hypothetical protein
MGGYLGTDNAAQITCGDETQTRIHVVLTAAFADATHRWWAAKRGMMDVGQHPITLMYSCIPVQTRVP